MLHQTTPVRRRRGGPRVTRPPQITSHVKTRVVAQGIDTLYLAIWLDLGDIGALLQARDRARLDGKSVTVTLAGWKWAVPPHGRRHFDLVLANDAAELRVRTGKTPAAMPRAYMELRSAFLWARGLERAMAWVRGVLAELGTVQEIRVSRVDVATDVAVRGGELFPEGAAHLSEWVTRAVRRGQWADEAWQWGRTFSGFRFGSDQIMVRVYDKTLEASRMGTLDRWRAVWRVSEEARVWRVEVQLRSEVLRELGVVTDADLQAKVGGVWRYVLTRWVSWREPRGTNQSRWPVRSFWRMLAERFVAPGVEVIRRALRDLRVERLLAGMAGYASSLAAVWGVDDMERVYAMAQEGVTTDRWRRSLAFKQTWTQVLTPVV